MTTILLIAYGDDFGTSTEIVKLDFGEPGVNVQEGFLKLGLPDGGNGTFYTAFENSGRELAIRITGYTHTRGNYKPLTNFYAGLSNLLRSSFLRNSPGVINVEISGLLPLSVYSIKTYHHSTSYARGGVSFYLQYEGNQKIKLKQSGNGKNPDPPLMHTEMVQSSGDGVVRLVMESEDGIGGVQNAHMDLNGMEIKYIGSTGNLKLDFGYPGMNIQEGFLKVGRPASNVFDWSGETVLITITGWTRVGGSFEPVTNAYAGLSNLLRSGFGRHRRGEMFVEISGLKRLAMYLITTYHHSTSSQGRIFSLQYEGNDEILLKQSSGQRPDPPLVHSELVQSSGDGIVRLVMNDGPSGVKQPSGAENMDLNGMEIKYIGMRSTENVKFDFGEPAVNVQEGFLKLGLPDGDSGTYVSAFEHFGQIATIQITGYTLTRGNFEDVVNSYSGLSNLLRSSFLRDSRGEMRVAIFGLKPQAMYSIKTYHHDTSYPLGGVTFSLQYDGHVKVLLKQSANGKNPDPPLIYTDIVRSNRYGIVRLMMDSGEGGGNVRGDAHMNLNGMEIAHVGKDNVKLDFGAPGVNVQKGFQKVGLPDGKGGTFTSTFEYLGQTRGIQITGYTHTRGNSPTIQNLYAGLSNLLRSSFLRDELGKMNVGISGLKPLTTYLIRTYHHSSSNGVASKFWLSYQGNTKISFWQSNGRNPNPPVIHTDAVQSDSDGVIRLQMDFPGPLFWDDPDEEMNLNGMEIKHTVTGSDSGKLDFGQPGVNVQDGYLKLGIPDTNADTDTTFTSKFEIFGQIATIKISGFTHIRGNYGAVRGPYERLSNLLRSGFIRNTDGEMKVEISGLKPLRMYLLKTYHHSSSWTDGGAWLYIEYEGHQGYIPKYQQSGNGASPDPPLTHSEMVLSNAGGKINLRLRRVPGHPVNVNMNLNGMEIYLCDA